MSRRQVVGARELKTRLGRYLRAVRDGATITVTERGQPVARLSPIAEHEEGIDAVLAELDAQGLITRASGEPFARLEALRIRGEPIDTTIDRERDDRL